MATMYRYQLPVEQTGWTLAGQTQTTFTWEYEDERERLLALYDKGKKQQKELWENLGLPVKEAIEVAMASENMRLFRKRLFSRIVPTVKDIGLWGPGVQDAFADMGAIEFADVDSDALLEQDSRVAEDFDAGVFVRKSIA